MKRFLCVFTAALLLFSLCACGEPPELTFTNSLGTEVHNVYVSPVEQEDWNEPVSNNIVSSGSTIQFDFSKIAEDAGPGTYDLGVIDENAMNYDAYAVPLAVGDQIDLSGDKNAATFTVTHADGSADTYDAFTYGNDDFE